MNLSARRVARLLAKGKRPPDPHTIPEVCLRMGLRVGKLRPGEEVTMDDINAFGNWLVNQTNPQQVLDEIWGEQ